MKRVLALFISVIMLFSMMEATVLASSSYETELLSALSIMQGDPNGNMRYGDRVSRAECAKIVVAASKYRDSVDTNRKSSPFKDVTSEHWAAPYVTAGIKNGLFKGYFDATFRPSNTVLYEEAITMLLRVLDYTDEDLGNNWPYDQIDTAKKIGMLDGVNKGIGQELTRRDISKMVFNTLNSKSKGSQDTYLSTFNRTVGPKTVLSSNWYEDFGAHSSITVMRDGVKSSVAEVRINDIAYYMEEYNTALVYSKKVTGIYESATPNKDAPTSVTVSGTTYKLEGTEAFSKLSSSGKLNYGDTVTLLLGKSGDIADVVTSQELSEKVYGFLTEAGTKQTTVSGTTVTKPYIKIVLPSGQSCEYITNKDYSSILNNPVSVTFENGTATPSKNLSNNGVSGKFVWSSDSKKLGSSQLADDISIIEVSTTKAYETATTATVFPQRLNGMSLGSSDILYASKNADGYVDELILDDTTGDMHTYGIITKAKNNITPASISGFYEYIANGNNYSLNTNNKSFNVSSGMAVKIISDGKSISAITKINKISSNKISDISGSTLTMSGKDYIMSDNVQIYIKNSYDYTMITMDELLENYNNYSASVYIDNTLSAGGRVRIIVLS